MKHLQCLLGATTVAALLGSSASASTVRACDRVVAASLPALDFALCIALSFTPLVAMGMVAFWLWQQPSPLAALLRRRMRGLSYAPRLAHHPMRP